jgi:hypothetical protein
MGTAEERRIILEMIESGKISAADGLELLKALGDAEATAEAVAPPEPSGPDLPPAPPEAGRRAVLFEIETGRKSAAAGAAETAAPPVEEPAAPAAPHIPAEPPNFERFRSFWQLPMFVGVGITVVSAALMALALQNTGYGFWFYCTWLPFLAGVAVIALAWASRTARWLHLRIYQKPGERPQRIFISLPLPLGLLAWFLRTFRGRIEGLRETNVEELIEALRYTGPNQPLTISVDDSDDGEHVEIYIG